MRSGLPAVSGRGAWRGFMRSTWPPTSSNAALERTGVPAARVEDVVLGCVAQIGEQAFDVARGAVLAAGLPISVPGKTVNRLCGSGLTAVADVAERHPRWAGRARHRRRGGVDDPHPHGLGRGIRRRAHLAAARRALPGISPTRGSPRSSWPGKWSLSRGQLDEFAAASQGKAVAARAAGWFRQGMVPVPVQDADGGTRLFSDDEHPRPGHDRRDPRRRSSPASARTASSTPATPRASWTARRRWWSPRARRPGSSGSGPGRG